MYRGGSRIRPKKIRRMPSGWYRYKNLLLQAQLFCKSEIYLVNCIVAKRRRNWELNCKKGRGIGTSQLVTEIVSLIAVQGAAKPSRAASHDPRNETWGKKRCLERGEAGILKGKN